MLTDFQNSFTNRLNSKFVVRIPQPLKCIAVLVLPCVCQMLVLKNVHVPELSSANCHAKLRHSTQLLKKYPLMLAQVC